MKYQSIPVFAPSAFEVTMASKKVRPKSSICDHGLSDDVILVSSTVVTNHKHSEIHRLLMYYCLEHKRYGNYSTTEIIPPAQRRSMAGVPGCQS
jgi:hypothetical protein